MVAKKSVFSIWLVILFSLCWLPFESNAALVAHWTFDEGSGTTAHDSTGSYNGTLAGSAAWSPAGGKAGGAVSLSRATGGYVTMGNALPLTATHFSLVAWVKTTAADNVILSKHQSTVVAGYIMAQNETGSYGSPGKAWFYGRGEPSLAPISATTVNDGIWHQIVVTYARGGNASIYVDGSPAEDFHSSAAIVDNGAPFLIGGLSTPWLTAEANFDGLIDDVQVYSQVLMPEEVQWLFDHPGQALLCAPALPGMVSWWKAEGTASDFIGNNNGTVNGASYASGKVGQAFSFDGTGNYVSIPDHPSLNPTAAITVDAWIFSDNSSSFYPPIVKKAGVSSGYALELTADGSQVHFWVHTVNSGWVGSPAAVVPGGMWSHVAGTYDGTNISLYVNGQLIGSTSATGSITPSNSELNIGRDPGFSTKLFKGLIDEVEIFNRALSAQEIAAIYNVGSSGLCGMFDNIRGLRLWLKADSGVIADGADKVVTWEDRSGNGLDITQPTENNQPVRIPAALNGIPVIRFDGSNDYLRRTGVPGSELFNNTNNTVFIVQKQAGGDQENSTFSWDPVSSNRFMVHATWRDVISYQIGDADIGGGGALDAPQPYGWDDLWHVLKLFREVNNGQITVDGIGLSPTRTFTSPGNNWPTGDLFIGSDLGAVNSTNDNWFNGDIAEILVFNRALSVEDQQFVENYLLLKYGLTSTPGSFSIPDKVDQPLSSLVESDSIMVTGINLLTPITISTGGEYSVNSGIYSATPGVVKNGDSVTVRQTSSASFSTTTDVTLTIGGVADTFSITTLDDTTPNPFIFTDQTGVPLNSLRESNPITVDGITGPTSISITGGEYKIGAGTYTSAEGAVNDGDTVKVRQTSSGSFSTTTEAVLTIGGVSDTFSVTTLAGDTTPSPFSFTDQTGAALNTVVESNEITVTEVNTAASISVTGGEYAFNGGAYTASAGMVNNGDTVRVRQTSSGSFSTTTEAVLTIGGVSDGFSVTTLGSINLFLPLITR